MYGPALLSELDVFADTLFFSSLHRQVAKRKMEMLFVRGDGVILV